VKRFLFALAVVAASHLGYGQTTLNNEAIQKMVKAGLSDDVIVSTIGNSAGQYVLTPDALTSLRQSGVDDKVISAMQAKGSSPQVVADTHAAAVETQPGNGQSAAVPAGGTKPRVFLQSESKGKGHGALRDQSMEMSKDFEKDCPDVKVTIREDAADYLVHLSHIEHGFSRDNQFQVANKDGDLISKTTEGGSIAGGVKKACALILADWQRNQQGGPPPKENPSR
jgi:hypothetical protein